MARGSGRREKNGGDSGIRSVPLLLAGAPLRQVFSKSNTGINAPNCTWFGSRSAAKHLVLLAINGVLHDSFRILRSKSPFGGLIFVEMPIAKNQRAVGTQ